MRYRCSVTYIEPGVPRRAYQLSRTVSITVSRTVRAIGLDFCFVRALRATHQSRGLERLTTCTSVRLHG